MLPRLRWRLLISSGSLTRPRRVLVFILALLLCLALSALILTSFWVGDQDLKYMSKYDFL